MNPGSEVALSPHSRCMHDLRRPFGASKIVLWRTVGGELIVRGQRPRPSEWADEGMSIRNLELERVRCPFRMPLKFIQRMFEALCW